MFPKLTLAQVRDLIVTLIIVAMAIGLAYYRDGWQGSKSTVKEATAAVKTANQTTAIVVQSAEIDQAVVVETATRITNNAAARVKNEQQHQQRVRKIDQQHRGQPNTPETEKQHSDALAKATIDSVWSAYCDVHPDSDCKE